MNTFLNNYKNISSSLEEIVRFFTENHNALNNLPAWLWDKRKAGIDFEKYKPLLAEAKNYIEYLCLQKVDLAELIRTNRNPARKLMVMIGHLLELGYQKIRFYPHVGGAGYWRYIITVSSSPEKPAHDAELSMVDTVWNSLGSGDGPYGWGDREEDSIEVLAKKFLKTCKTIRRLAKGEDRRYVEWYQSMLAMTEPDGVIYFWWDGSYERNKEHIGILEKEGGRQPLIPYPPDYEKMPDSHYPRWLLA